MIGASVGILSFSSAAWAQDDLPSRAELWEVIQKQQKQIDALTGKQQKTEKKVEATATAVEKVQNGSVFGGDRQTVNNGWFNDTQIGGYGEMHYNGLKDSGDDEIDFHRYVLFVSHQFNDDLRMFSEVEIEHSIAGEGQPGEVELEQAFIEYDISETQQARAGLFLLPVGILNETHEPPTFFGVERNPVEKNIIPSTWWEGGLGLNGELPNNFSYDVAVHSGLNTATSGSKAFNIRSGRQKVAEAQADKGAVTGRIKWTGAPGVELAATGQYQQDVAQGDFSESVSATLFETHADVRRGPFGLRALYARWDMDGNAPEAIGADEQFGWYIEPSYRFETRAGEVGLFARYNQYDTTAGAGTDTEIAQTDVGINFWPHPDVVLKADMAFVNNPAGASDDEVLNLGVGFQF
jgi:hypothetical protein